MKKSELKQLIREEIGKLRISSWPLKTISWEDLSTDIQPPFILPENSSTKIQIETPEQFQKWLNKLIRLYGDEGNLIYNGNSFKIEGNSKWDGFSKSGDNYMTNLYKNKRYTGD